MRIPHGLRAASGNVGGWDLDSATYTGVSYTLGTSMRSPGGLTFDPTGAYLYQTGASTNRIARYTMSTPYNISSITSNQSYVPGTVSGSVRGIYFKPDGTAHFFVDSAITDRVRRYDMSTAWDLTTSSYTSQSNSISSIDTLPAGLFIRDNGTDVYSTGDNNNIITQWQMTTSWDITTLSHVRSFSTSVPDVDPYAVWFKPNGTRMFYVSDSAAKVVQCELSTPWDISSASVSKSFSVSTQEPIPRSFTFNPSGTIMLIAGSNDIIYEYSL